MKHRSSSTTNPSLFSTLVFERIHDISQSLHNLRSFSHSLVSTPSPFLHSFVPPGPSHRIDLEDEALMLERLETCVRDLRVWMNRNRLKLNDSKTEFIIFGTSRFLKCVRTTSILVVESNIAASKEVRNIGAMFDCHMKMNAQVRTICRGAWLNLYNISKVRSYLNDDQTRCVVHAYVISKLDANNSLLAGSPSRLVSQIERVQNAAAKLVTKSKKFDHVSPILRNLHWLPIQDRIVFKNLLLIYKALNNKGPTIHT